MKKKIKILATITAICLIFCLALNFNTVSASERYLYLGGYTCGFNLKTRGATVVGVTDVITDKGVISPSKCAGLEIGDIILSINGKKVNGSSDLSDCLNQSKGNFITVEYLRNGNLRLCDIFPEKDISGNYKIGVIVRDDLSGLGTVTYIDEDGNFGSLGHPVASQSGEIFEIVGGEVFECSIIGINKAVRGKAGELKGIFIGEKAIGSISSNKSVGMFGKFNNFNKINHKKMAISKASMGKAQIVCTIDSTSCETFDIEIVKCDYNKQNKNFVIKITDKDLLSKTGGILQGMSGSPIIQNNKIVGAVTHVFLNDSSRGYGISIYNMLNN